ncbi:MAG: methyltransferase [Marivibrio sp.]|uniref:methyltransferase n=1 Tax=Marivibrio sp. TaxID=2039719 RepID=UPI0032EF036F
MSEGASLRDRWRDWRNRKLADPDFQHRAIANPLLRPFARMGVRRSFDLVAGFVYSQTLAAFVALDLLDRLKEAPQSEAALSDATDLDPAALNRLMKAAAAVGLAERFDDGRWGLGADGAALAGSPGARAMIRHHDALYRDLTNPVALLRGEAGETELARFWRYAGEADGRAVKPEEAEGYSRLMAESQSLLAEEILAAYPMDGTRRILDVGGGGGAFLTAVAARHPQAQLTLFDLPGVAEYARAEIARRGLAKRISVAAGDFMHDPLPAGCDLITLVRILHDHDDDKALALLKACRVALADVGALLIAEPMSGRADAARVADAYFGFYLLAMGSGRARTPDEISALLDAADFRIVTPLTTRNPLMVQAIAARPRA